MIKLLTANTPHGQRAALILEECGLDYQVKTLDLMRGDQRLPAFLKLNPRGQIPVVVDEEGTSGRLVLAQSSAILLHYAMSRRVLWPEDPQEQALALQWVMQATSDMSSVAGALYALRHFVPERSESTIDYFVGRLEPHLTYVEGRLAEVPYLAGPLSVADLALYPVVVNLSATIEELGEFPSMRAWAERLAARPAVERGMTAHERGVSVAP